ncbi:TetR/AcrR family transcriptional regulator [Streptomyces sp. SP18CS02]|uniref:TetR/AcrR family transcriptional regulator n=1 Tax=Streptomyces sp. SP18CS02 TaxID=3002531 RepID=UPI002E76DEBE|nr:TetR/AcrR family transcriptional regulator [Streptomyces sp. SP18CS02]MEE1754662.1 TetR/AcrR family transcriptional regulator [Streptomyces sp. SP18CS02]
MPRQADHDQRRRQIAEAVWRLAGRGGLEDVTLRQVAAEAGVSVRLVQYYFGSRDGLLLTALEILDADAEQRAHARVTALGADAGPRAILRNILLELLPLDRERRTRHLVHAAYFLRFLRDPALAREARDAPLALEELVAALIGRGRPADPVSPAVDTRSEAAFLLAGAHGLRAGVLLGQRSAEQAVALLDLQLDRVFGTAGSRSVVPAESRDG